MKLFHPIRCKEDAYTFLEEIGAPSRLIKHAKLVGEAAELLIEKCKELSITMNYELIELGVAFHDSGKILFPSELDAPGDLHEPAGQELLLEYGLDPNIARCCLSHARYDDMEVTVEELIIALSDKLWKGKREGNLELKIIDKLACLIGKGRWEIFSEFDSVFEQIAADGTDRLGRSV